MSAGLFELLTGSSTPLLASGDVVCFVDVSDTTQAAQGSLVKATQTQFFAALNVPVVVTSASAGAFAVGLSGTTNSAFKVDASTALQVAGLTVTGAVTGGTVAVVVTDSGAAANFTLNAKGTGTIGIGSVSTGRVTITPVTTITGALTLSAALTYGGVTLSNAVTGTGNMVLSAGPTLTGTIAGAAMTLSSTLIVTTSVTTPSLKSAAGADLAIGTTSAGTALTFTSATGAATFGGVAVSGLTTLSGSGAVSGFTTLALSSGATGTTATFTSSATATTLTIDNTNGSSQGSGIIFKQASGTSRGFVGVSGTWLGTTASNMAVSAYTGGVEFYTNGGSTVGMSLSTGNVLTVASGLTVSAGTTAVQALTATTIAPTGTISRTTWAAGNTGIDFTAVGANDIRIAHVGSTGSDSYFGTASSAGGNLVTGSAAYSVELRSDVGFYFGIGATKTVAITSGALAVTGGISCTTVAPSGAITQGNNTGGVYTNLGTTTNSKYLNFGNTSGDAFFGVDNSAGGNILVGTSAYSVVIGTSQAKSMHLGTNNTVKVTVTSGGDVAIVSGAKLFVDGIAATGNTYITETSPDLFSIVVGGAVMYQAGVTQTLNSNTSIAGTITTADPNSGAGAWKLGTYLAAGVALDTAHYVEISIGGTLRKLAIVT